MNSRGNRKRPEESADASARPCLMPVSHVLEYFTKLAASSNRPDGRGRRVRNGEPRCPRRLGRPAPGAMLGPGPGATHEGSRAYLSELKTSLSAASILVIRAESLSSI